MAQGKEHVPTDDQRKLVEIHSAIGTRQDAICSLLDISLPTLHKHYRDELDNGMTRANGQVGGALFSAAMEGNVTAQIWWTKARMGWSETQTVTLQAEPFTGFDIDRAEPNPPKPD